MIDLVVGDRPIARERLDIMIKEASRDIYRGMREAFNHKWLLVRSSLIGTFVGIMPGMKATVNTESLDQQSSISRSEDDM